MENAHIEMQIKALGHCPLRDSMYIASSEYMMAEQKLWDEDDDCKAFDFTASPFWVCPPDAEPLGFDSIDEALAEVEA